jgi:crossover junction endodeoxyribonuclease RuvC
MKNILGIDPGASGAIALVFTDWEEYDNTVLLHDIDNNITQVCNQIKNWTDLYKIHGVVIEKVSAFPGQGVTSMFSFGEIYGLLKGICLGFGIPILAEPRPQDWKKRVGIVLNPPKKPNLKDCCLPSVYKIETAKHKTAVAAYKREQKNVSRNRAAELYPNIVNQLTRVKDSDRAEAVLIAHYGTLEAAK